MTTVLAAQATRDDIESVVAAVQRLDRTTPWRVTASHPLDFVAHHPQGITRVGDRLLLSSVQIIEETQRYQEPVDGFDRSAGQGRAHLFEIDLAGRLLRQITLGEESIYHPGGIAYDGDCVWVPVSEYRPDSRAIVYRVDPQAMEATEAFRFDDHLGAMANDRLTGLLHAATWGSGRFLAMDVTGRVLHQATNSSRYVDFQDCVAVGYGKLVCAGVTEYPSGNGGMFSLGGIAVLDVSTTFVQHEVPMTLLSPGGRVVTYNAVHLEVLPDASALRMYAVPDDGHTPGESSLLILEAPLG